MTTKAIVGYLYRDEYYCPGCIAWILDSGASQDTQDNPEAFLDELAAEQPVIDRSREGSFSQRDFPHTITSGQLDEPAPLCETCRTEIR